MEKVFEYTVPKDCTVKIEQSKDSFVVLIESKQVEFKDGDIIYMWVSDVMKSMIIVLKGDYTFKANENNMTSYVHISLEKNLRLNGVFGTNDVTEFRLATEDEKQILFDALAKEGKQWNPEKRCVEPLKHIPKEGDFVRYKNKYGTGYFVCGGHSATSVKQKQTTCYIFSSDEKIRVYDASSASIGFPISTNIFETISKDEFCKSINDLGYEYNFETNEIEPLKWQPKEGDEVHRVIFSREEDKFIIHSFTWHKGCQLNGVHKPSIKEAQQLCNKLNSVLNEK